MPGRALSAEEQQSVIDTLHSEQFRDMAVPQVHANLLDQGIYLCSVSTMYRLLRARGETTERRRQREHKPCSRPELLATGPNQVWSWDITKLKGPRKWSYYYLYVILDVFSRYVVGWMIAEREGADLAKALIEESVERQNVPAGQLTIHADRGPAMISGSVAELLANLGVDKSHSRPHVSNDNPFSESHFKTMKYRPQVPERFGSAEGARELFRDLFAWYNEEHRHSGIAMLTPCTVHSGQAGRLLAARQGVLCEAYAGHPERFVKRAPKVEPLPAAVWINPPAAPEAATEQQTQVAAAAPPKQADCPRAVGQGEHPS